MKATSMHGDDDAAVGLVGFARSSEGATIVLKDGLIPRQGLQDPAESPPGIL